MRAVRRRQRFRAMLRAKAESDPRFVHEIRWIERVSNTLTSEHARRGAAQFVIHDREQARFGLFVSGAQCAQELGHVGRLGLACHGYRRSAGSGCAPPDRLWLCRPSRVSFGCCLHTRRRNAHLRILRKYVRTVRSGSLFRPVVMTVLIAAGSLAAGALAAHSRSAGSAPFAHTADTLQRSQYSSHAAAFPRSQLHRDIHTAAPLAGAYFDSGSALHSEYRHAESVRMFREAQRLIHDV